MNRRSIIKLLTSAPIGMALSACSTTRLTEDGSSILAHSETGRLAHGLFFGPEKLADLRDLYSNNTFFADVQADANAVDRDDLRRFIESEVRLNDQITDLPRLARESEILALHFLLTDDEDAGELAKECIRTILRFPKWDYFIDGDDVIGVQRAPAAAIAIALTSDWLGDSLSDAERRQWLVTMGERGCTPCYASLYDIANPRQVSGWRFDPESTITVLRPGNFTDMNRRPEITQTTNLRAIPASGLIIGALALADAGIDSQLTEKWIGLGVETIRAFGDIYQPDGSYHEGASYANYTSDHLIQAMVVLKRKRQLDLYDVINWEGHAEYLLNMSLPTTADPADIVNFGDNGNPKTGLQGSVKRTAVPFWIASTFDSGHAQWFAQNRAGTPNMRSLFFYDRAVKETPASAEPTLWESDLDWVVARTGYESDDLVVAMRSGGPANHEHADRNSIVVKCFGEQLITDPYRPPYSFADPAWKMRLTEGHSAILIDGKGHEHHNGVEGTNASQSTARIVSSEHNSDYAMWSSDASQPYRLVDLNIASVVRTVVVFYNIPGVVVIDRVIKREDPSPVQARFFGFNWDGKIRHEVGTNEFTVERPGAILHATSFCPNGLEIASDHLDIVEERAIRHPFIKVSTPAAMETVLVTAMGIGRTASSVPRAVLSSGDGITAKIGDRSVRVDASGNVSVI